MANAGGWRTVDDDAPSDAGLALSTAFLDPSDVGLLQSTAILDPSDAGLALSTAFLDPSDAGLLQSTAILDPSDAGPDDLRPSLAQRVEHPLVDPPERAVREDGHGVPVLRPGREPRDDRLHARGQLRFRPKLPDQP
jgi:hypothetical protein